MRRAPSPALLCTLVIFSLSATARGIQQTLEQHFAKETIAALLLLAGVALCIALFRSSARAARPLRACTVSLLMTALTAGCAWQLRRDPEEIFHLFEYGLLSFLFAPARVTALGERLTAALLASSVGVADELYQWLLPSRVFDLRDIGLNFFAAAVVQLGFIAASADRSLRSTSSPPSSGAFAARPLQAALLLSLLLLLLSLLTPTAVVRLSAVSPSLASLRDEAVLDFGYEHRLGESVRFRSRFSEETLESIDSARGAEVERLLAHRSGDREDFLRAHSELIDPFVNEAEVHLFRRDLYRRRSDELPDDREAARAALGEEQILARYFHNSVSHALLDTGEEQLLEMRAGAGNYESPVAANLITDLRPRALQLTFAAVSLLLLLLSLRPARNRA